MSFCCNCYTLYQCCVANLPPYGYIQYMYMWPTLKTEKRATQTAVVIHALVDRQYSWSLYICIYTQSNYTSTFQTKHPEYYGSKHHFLTLKDGHHPQQTYNLHPSIFQGILYPPPNLQHKYAAKLFIRLAAKFNALMSLLHNQVLRGTICDHTIFCFWQ